jgi:hypothetical protein
MEFTPRIEITTYCPEVLLNEDTLERTFICPVSGVNVYTWDLENPEYPEELVFHYFEQAEEPFYIKREYAPLLGDLSEYKENTVEFGSGNSFVDCVLSRLPQHESFYCLALCDPDFPCGGENTYLIYRGEYKD